MWRLMAASNDLHPYESESRLVGGDRLAITIFSACDQRRFLLWRIELF